MTNENATKDVQIERTFDALHRSDLGDVDRGRALRQLVRAHGGQDPQGRDGRPVGGRRHIGMEMETPNGPMQMFFVGEYREIDPKTRLVYTESMADADGNAMTAEQMGMPLVHPMETIDRGRTRRPRRPTKMVMTHVGVPGDSPGGQGWAMAIDKLADRVASLS